MAVDAPLVARVKVFGCKAEATTGTAESITAAEGAYNIIESSLTPEIPMIDRPAQGTNSMLTGTHGIRTGRMSLRNQLDNSAGITTLLSGCGVTAGALKSDPANMSSLTMALFEHGRKRFIAGAMGSVTFAFRSGQVTECNWDFQGVWQPPATVAIIAPTLPTAVPTRFASATFTIGAAAYKASSLDIAIQNTIVIRESHATAAGAFAAVITDRRIIVTTDPESLALGTKDWYADWLAGTEAALSVVASNATIAAPKMQLTNVQPGVRNGIMTDILTFQCNRSAANDDELTIAIA